MYNLDNSNNLIDHNADYVLGCSSLTDRTCSGQNFDYMDYMPAPAYDPVNDRLFVLDPYDWCRVLVFDLSNGITNGMDASNVIGQDDFSTSDCNSVSASHFGTSYYGALALDTSSQYLFVTDTYSNYRILAFDVSPGNIHNGMDASYVIGQSDLTSNDYGGCDINLVHDGYGMGLVVDSVNHRLFYANGYECYNVLVYDVSPDSIHNGMDASYVLGCVDFTCNDYGNAGDWGYLNAYGGLAYDPDQQLLYVNDYYYRVLIFDVKTITNGEHPIGVLGEPDIYTTSPTDLSQLSLYIDYYSGNSTFDPTNRRLYVTDDYNNRYLIFDFAHLLSASNGTVGTTYTQSLGAGTQGTTTFTLDSGSLPPGLTLNTTTGTLSGTPTTPGSYTFTISVSDDNGTVGTYTDTKSYVLGIAATTSNNSTTTTATTTTTTTNTTSSSIVDTTNEQVAQTDTETIPDTTSSPTTPTTSSTKPTPAPQTTTQTSSSVLWWGVGGVSLFLILILIGMLVVKGEWSLTRE